jgi:hypothetical protein
MMDKSYSTKYPQGAGRMTVEKFTLDVVSNEGETLGSTEVFVEMIEAHAKHPQRRVVMRSCDIGSLVEQVLKNSEDLDEEETFVNSSENADNDGNYCDPEKQTSSIFEGLINDKPLGAKMVAESYEEFPSGCIEE